MPKTYTVRQVADILGYSTNSIYTFLKEKRLRGVRVGRGRFRIPEQELARVLHLSKKESSVTGIQSPVVSPMAVQAPTGDAVFVEAQQLSPDGENVSRTAPNIFDYFVGTTAMIIGLSLFVFNARFGDPDAASFVRMIPLLRIVLLASGIGVLVSSMIARFGVWHKLFHIVLAIVTLGNAYTLFRVQDVTGAVLYGVLGIVVLVSTVVRFGGIVTVLLYVSTIAAAVPLAMVLAPSDPHVTALLSTVPMTPVVALTLSVVVGMVLSLGAWVGYAKQRSIFTIATWCMALCDVAVAVWFAHSQYWNRAFFMLIVSYFTGILPYWWPLQQALHRRYAYILHGVLCGVAGVLLVAVFIVYVLQQSLWNTKTAEIANKLQIAKTSVTNALDSVQSSLLVAAGNQDFVRSVEKKSLVTLNSYAKIVYESNLFIRRLVFLDADGAGIALYPYGTFDEPSFAYRDYFQQVKTTKKLFVSNVFQVRSDQDAQFVVVVAVPFLNARGDFVGAMTASVDLERISLHLGQIIDSAYGEQFTVVDTRGTILVHEDRQRIGTALPDDHVLRQSLTGSSDVTTGRTMDEVMSLIGWTYVEKTQWGIGLVAPAVRVLSVASFAIWSMFGVIVVLLLLSTRVFAFIQRRLAQGERSP
jgi:excisionase family DNA binding protein